MFKIPENEIKQIKYRGLSGRMLHLPHKKTNKVILFIPGQHSSQERNYSICQYLNDFGEVYAPDTPGFGGMDSFYKVGLKPSFDEYADYLADQISKIDSKKELWIVAVSLGSELITRTLQKHPDIKPAKVFSFGGFGSAGDFRIPLWFRVIAVGSARFASSRIGAAIFDAALLNPLSLKLFVKVLTSSKKNTKDQSGEELATSAEMETTLWRINDTRTHAATGLLMFKDDLRNYSSEKISTTIYNISSESDQFFDNVVVEQTMLDLYDGYKLLPLKYDSHAPSVIADKQEVYELAPQEFTQMLKN